MDSSLTEVPLISVVVPVYKVEKYLKKCVDSIIAQTYKNIEIILVDDGSPDSCPEICDEYAEKDSRVKVVHQQNGGLSAARNSGIKAAAGEYISFVDSDDFIQPLYIEQLFITARDSGAPVSMCSYSYDENGLNSEIINDFKIYTAHDAVKEILTEKAFTTSAWSKLYKTDLFGDILFPEGAIFEDYAAIPRIISKAGSAAYVDSKLYYYTVNTDSITKSFFSKKHMQYFEIADAVNAFIDSEYHDLLDCAYNRDTSMAVAYFRKISRSDYNEKDVINELVARIRKGRKLFMKSSYPFSKRCACFAIALSPAAAKLILKH